MQRGKIVEVSEGEFVVELEDGTRRSVRMPRFAVDADLSVVGGSLVVYEPGTSGHVRLVMDYWK